MIDFNEIQSQHTPSVQAELDREGGLSSLGVDKKTTLFLGYKTSAGGAVAGAADRITSVDKAVELYGTGSMLARMAAAFLDIAPMAPLYGASFAEGGGAVAATGTITVTVAGDGKATKPGTVKATIGGQFVQAGWGKDAEVEDIVDYIVAAFAQKTNNLSFTLTKGAGTAFVLTIAARNKGPEGNSIRIHVEYTLGAGVTIVVAAMSGGLTAGDPTSTLAGLEAHRYHLVGLGLSDATTIGVLAEDREKQSAPAVQKWGIGAVGCIGARTDAETLVTAADSYNVQVVWEQESEIPVFELVARFCAERALLAAKKGIIDRKIKGVPPARDRTKWPSKGEIEAAIEGGVTPIRPLENGTCQIVRSVLTRQTAPISYRDHIFEEIWHYTSESIIGAMEREAKGHPLKSASPPGGPNVITPERATTILNRVLFDLDKQDYLQGVKKSIKAGHNFAEVNAIEPSLRLDAGFDYIPVGLAVQIAMKATLRSPLAV